MENNTASSPIAAPEEDLGYVGILGSLDRWSDELKSNRKIRREYSGSSIAEGSRGSIGYSRLAQRGAAELLNVVPPSFDLENVRSTIEASYDYWSGKMFTLVHQPMAMLQVIQDELNMHWNSVPHPPSAPWPELSTPTLHLNAMLRTLQYNATQYVFWLEMKDALNRLDNSPSQDLREGKEGSEEIEWIRRLAGMSASEAGLNMRLLFAGGVGRDYLSASMPTSPEESKDIIKDIQFTFSRPLSELTQVERTTTSLFLRPEESQAGDTCGPSIHTRFLAFEQACEEQNVQNGYSYALQLAIGEYSLPLNLLMDLPRTTPPGTQSPSSPQSPRDAQSQPPNPKTLTKSLSVRLNMIQSSLSQICTMLPDISIFCDPHPRQRRQAMEQGMCEAFWDAVRASVGIMLERLDIPKEVRGRVLPFLSEEEEGARWLPGKSIIGESTAGSSDSVQSEQEAEARGDVKMEQGQGGEVRKQVWQVSSEDLEVWRKIFEIEGGAQGRVGDLVQLFRSIDFNVDRLGGSFVRFAPPDSAGASWILRAPVGAIGQGLIPLSSIGQNLNYMYGWDISWFVRKDDDEKD